MSSKIKWLSDGTLKKLTVALCGEARELDDGTWIPMVFVAGEWQDSPRNEPSHDRRPEAVQRSRELNHELYKGLAPSA